MLPFDANAFTNSTSLRAPDGDTSDHSRDYVSLTNLKD